MGIQETEDRQKAQFKKMTETPIAPLVIKLGIPTTISMLVTSIYNMADTFLSENMEPARPEPSVLCLG